MEVRILHLGEQRWIVQSQGDSNGPRFEFKPTDWYRPLGLAANRDYVSPGDLIDVDAFDLVEVS